MPRYTRRKLSFCLRNITNNSMKSNKSKLTPIRAPSRMPSINIINVLTRHPSLNPFLNEISCFVADG